MAKLTIQDVARLAGVSTATVSRAIQFPDHAAQKHAGARAAGHGRARYIYNATAGDLSRRKSSVLGAFIPTTESAKLRPR
jgi:DNA-binding LacI/PurR family transcriptional regulator